MINIHTCNLNQNQISTHPIENQLILIDKQPGWTSFDILAKIKSSIKPFKLKIGHAGTLDPFASGLLIACTGKLTKQINHFQSMDKTYQGTMKFGSTTPSYDNETEPNQYFPFEHLSSETIHQQTNKFIGEITQIPPIFSAIKINGKRLYQYARKSSPQEISELKIAPRQITIHEFKIIKINWPEIEFIVKCSKGTYIRSLAHDFASSLNSGAHLISLRRLSIGEFNVENALSVQQICTKYTNAN